MVFFSQCKKPRMEITMKLEKDPTKNLVRNTITDQMEQEQFYRNVPTRIVTLPSDYFTQERTIIETFPYKFPKQKFTLHCYAADYCQWERNIKRSEDILGVKFIKGARQAIAQHKNIKIIYEWGVIGDINKQTVRNILQECNKLGERLMIWLDYCGMPIKSRVATTGQCGWRNTDPIGNLHFILENAKHALVYQTHYVTLRNVLPSKRRESGLGSVKGPRKIAQKLIENFSHHNAALVYDDLYINRGACKNGMEMFTWGYRTSQTKAAHITKVMRNYTYEKDLKKAGIYLKSNYNMLGPLAEARAA